MPTSVLYIIFSKNKKKYMLKKYKLDYANFYDKTTAEPKVQK